MPPRSSLTSSFSVVDATNEVECPLFNQDGSACRKRCLGEKRFRSIQEHIRRAHPSNYIAKLPATEESFLLMINTAPRSIPPPQPQQAPQALQPPQPQIPNTGLAPPNGGYPPNGNEFIDPGLYSAGYPVERNSFYGNESGGNTPRILDDFSSGSLLPAASAAAALAQLHNHKIEDWESEIEWLSDTEGHAKALLRSSIELPPIHQGRAPTSEPYPQQYSVQSVTNPNRPRDSYTSLLNNSPPGRSTTLPPIQRHGSARPPKQTVTKRAAQPQHKRKSSIDAMNRRMSQERKAYSAEPPTKPTGYGSRWEDLIEAATSATEDVNEDRTPMPESPRNLPRSPMNRNSLPPFQPNHFQGYQASPLQRALTPPIYDTEIPDPFPSVEGPENGDAFHLENRGIADSSPAYSSQSVQIYCAACQGVCLLKEAFACTECICGICQPCADLFSSAHGSLRKCPRCSVSGGKFKRFQLDVR